MHVELEARVPGVAPADALAWWTDFRSGHTDHTFIPGVKRRILARGEDGITMEDDARVLGLVPVFHERTTARVEAERVVFEGVNTFATFRGVYAFLPDDAGGTRIALAADIQLKRGLRWSDPVAARLARVILQKDLDGHAREMGREVG